MLNRFTVGAALGYGLFIADANRRMYKRKEIMDKCIYLFEYGETAGAEEEIVQGARSALDDSLEELRKLNRSWLAFIEWRYSPRSLVFTNYLPKDHLDERSAQEIEILSYALERDMECDPHDSGYNVSKFFTRLCAKFEKADDTFAENYFELLSYVELTTRSQDHIDYASRLLPIHPKNVKNLSALAGFVYLTKINPDWSLPAVDPNHPLKKSLRQTYPWERTKTLIGKDSSILSHRPYLVSAALTLYIIGKGKQDMNKEIFAPSSPQTVWKDDTELQDRVNTYNRRKNRLLY